MKVETPNSRKVCAITMMIMQTENTPRSAGVSIRAITIELANWKTNPRYCEMVDQ
jgi:hypothetical protein